MFGKLKDLLTLNKALGQYEDLKKEIDSMDAKHALLSKTVWLNVIGLGLTIAPILPAKYSLPALAILNILNRFATSGEITISLDALKQAFSSK